ncbi:vWA domain-containing protein [Zavarzinella formosa]|uniref:VWA domain-containing protein n=1 Tax=Zavarzinella formosa TaxID=360055 RepID=UPI0002FEB56C|nr:VWA domain-containing protein [Zavarzinella formosa]
MNTKDQLGGVVHTYLGYDAINFPSPTAEPPDLASAAMEHLLYYGNTRKLTEEELANAVKIDPSQIRGLGPSLEAIAEMLRERKRKILATYETDTVQKDAGRIFHESAGGYKPPKKLADRFDRAVKEEQLRDLENLYYAVGNDRDPFARSLVPLIQKLGDKYQVDALASKYDFTGRQSMTVPKALEIKEELETIDKLLEQIEEAKKTAQVGLIDMEELSEFIDSGNMDELRALQQQINEYLRDQAEKQGITPDRRGFQLSPKAYRLFQSKLLQTIFADLAASKTGRHSQAVTGEGAVESQRTKDYEFGDSVTQMDIPSSMINAMLRSGAKLPVRMTPDDIVIHRTQVNPKAATTVLLDMSGSMRYGEQYVNVKRMALALDGLIRTEFPGDFLQFIEMFTFAKPRTVAELPSLMPKPVTLYDPVVRLKADMSDPDMSELQIPPHFTNIQHAMQLGRRFLSRQDTPNRQMIIITDGLPTAHFEGNHLFLLYPPDPRTEQATLREATLCAREQITINIFLLQSWNQTEEDVRFAYKLAQTTKGRVIFTAGKELDRFVVWDYVKNKKSIIG